MFIIFSDNPKIFSNFSVFTFNLSISGYDSHKENLFMILLFLEYKEIMNAPLHLRQPRNLTFLRIILTFSL